MRLLDIGVDLDGPCYDFPASVRNYRKRYKGVPVETMPDPQRWDFHEDWGITLEEFLEDVTNSVNACHTFAVGDPHPHSAETIRFLHSLGHRIHVITARESGRPGKAEWNTRYWLRKHAYPYTTLTFSSDKTIIPTDIFIEDSGRNYDALEAAGSNPVLIDRPWNRDHPGRRVYGWHQFTDMVLDLSKR